MRGTAVVGWSPLLQHLHLMSESTVQIKGMPRSLWARVKAMAALKHILLRDAVIEALTDWVRAREEGR